MLWLMFILFVYLMGCMLLYMYEIFPFVKILVIEIQCVVFCCGSRNPEILDECDLDEKTLKVLLSNIKRRMTPQSVKIRSGKAVIGE